ncbi:MAG: hypothetical protein Q7V01_02275 [Vicinamibacterales bacterium]|nr:hypothetical protein [Vicinamibacterales bacterium]
MLTGCGSAGAYQAGVLKAFSEAGVRVDIVAGQGMGVVSALFHAVDGGSRLWAGDGAWAQKDVARFYGWRPAVRALAWAATAALATAVMPMAALALGTLVYLGAFLAGLLQLTAATELADWYTALVHDAFLPGRLTTWIPQLTLLLLAVVLLLLVVASWRSRTAGRTRERGAFWWRVLGAPVSAAGIVQFWRRHLWQLLIGGARMSEPDAVQLSRRYAELLAENLGQPGFREVVAVVHDSDARHDVVMAALAEPYRRAFFARGFHGSGGGPRAAEAMDLVGVDRDHVTDLLAAALCLPVAAMPWPVTFAPESYWRGETHRLCDRPGAVARVLEEVLAAGAEQVIVVSSVSSASQPHALAAPRLDGFGKLGEWLASQEAAAVRDAIRAQRGSFRNLHVIVPAHNPTGPLDFAGAYDDRSDRVQGFAEVMARGYEDAYQQFIEPAVGGADEGAPSFTPGR